MQNEKTYWRKWYTGVLLFLAVQILLFWWITLKFN
jgi:hypothetical protein